MPSGNIKLAKQDSEEERSKIRMRIAELEEQEAQQIAAAQTTVIPFFIAGAFYYIFNFVVAWVMENFEKKLDYYR